MLRRKDFVSSYSQSAVQESQGRDCSSDCGGVLPTGLPSMACSAYLFNHRPPTQGWLRPQWAGPSHMIAWWKLE